MNEKWSSEFTDGEQRRLDGEQCCCYIVDIVARVSITMGPTTVGEP